MVSCSLQFFSNSRWFTIQHTWPQAELSSNLGLAQLTLLPGVIDWSRLSSASDLMQAYHPLRGLYIQPLCVSREIWAAFDWSRVRLRQFNVCRLLTSWSFAFLLRQSVYHALSLLDLDDPVYKNLQLRSLRGNIVSCSAPVGTSFCACAFVCSCLWFHVNSLHLRKSFWLCDIHMGVEIVSG